MAYPVVISAYFKDEVRLPDHLRHRVLEPPLLIAEDFNLLARVTECSDALWFTSAFAVAEQIREGRLAEVPPPSGQARQRFRMMMYSLDRRTLSPAVLRLAELFQQEISALERCCGLS